MNADTMSPTVNLSQALFDLRKQFNQQVEPHQTDLWRYCLHLTDSVWDAEDLMQDTLLKAFARLSTIFQPLEMKPYLFKIASNTWVDQIRRAKLLVDDTVDELPSDAPTSDPIAIQAAIERLVQVLPPRQRIACLLIDVFGFSLADAAQFLQIGVGATKSLLHRARTTLQTHQIQSEFHPHIELCEVPDSDLVKLYVEAFNRQDLEAMLALIHPEATSDILGVFVEEGRETMRRGSLHAWANDPNPQSVKYGKLENRPTLFVFVKNEAGVEGLAWLITLTNADGQIIALKDYYFCADLVRYVAQLMGVTALPNLSF